MNNATQQNQEAMPERPYRRRRRHFIDTSVQGRLLIAMLVMEMLLFGGTMVWLYLDLNQVVESNMYRVHFGSQKGLSPLLREFLYIVPLILLVNLAGLWVADRIWRRSVSRIINTLQSTLTHIGQFDLREAKHAAEVKHEVLDKADEWLAYERLRYRNIQQVSRNLPDKLDISDSGAVEQARSALERLQQLLK